MNPVDPDSSDMLSTLKNLCLRSSPKQKKRNNVMVPVHKDEKYYKMTHKKRGYAVIFNHIDFDQKLKTYGRFDRRDPGTIEDARRLENTFRGLGFEVVIRDDMKLTTDIVRSTLSETSRKDFTEYDCLIIVVLSHGDTDKIFAYNTWYSTDELIDNFTPDKCPSLAGKPKILVLNLCQGRKRDLGVDVRVETDNGDRNGNIQIDGNGSSTYRIPLYADFLLAYSTATGFMSYLDEDGSCYVKAFCEVFDEYGTNTEITTLLTYVHNRVANFDIVNVNCPDLIVKQMPCFMTRLTRLVIFGPK